jgi:hypothetical protein
MENKIGIFILFLGVNLFVFAQNDDVSVTYHQSPTVKDTSKYDPDRDEILRKIAVGGMLAVQAGTVTYIEVSPDVSYHFNKWVAAGVGGTYIFAHDSYDKESFHVFGARAFVEGHFFNYLGLYASYQALNYNDFRPQTLGERIWSNNLSVGGGYYRRAERFSMYAFVLYNISNREGHNVYGNVLFKVGFNVFLKK